MSVWSLISACPMASVASSRDEWRRRGYWMHSYEEWLPVFQNSSWQKAYDWPSFLTQHGSRSAVEPQNRSGWRSLFDGQPPRVSRGPDKTSGSSALPRTYRTAIPLAGCSRLREMALRETSSLVDSYLAKQHEPQKPTKTNPTPGSIAPFFLALSFWTVLVGSGDPKQLHDWSRFRPSLPPLRMLQWPSGG